MSTRVDALHTTASLVVALAEWDDAIQETICAELQSAIVLERLAERGGRRSPRYKRALARHDQLVARREHDERERTHLAARCLLYVTTIETWRAKLTRSARPPSTARATERRDDVIHTLKTFELVIGEWMDAVRAAPQEHEEEMRRHYGDWSSRCLVHLASVERWRSASRKQ